MNNHLFVSELLQENYPIECEIVGAQNLQDIVESEVIFESAESGSYMDLSQTIGLLSVAVTFIKTVIDIYTALKNELKRKPNKNEIEIRIVESKKGFNDLDKASRKRLIKAIIDKLENEK